jgi:hypothetical protein
MFPNVRTVYVVGEAKHVIGENRKKHIYSVHPEAVGSSVTY